MLATLALLLLTQSPPPKGNPVRSKDALSVSFVVSPLVLEPGRPPALTVTMRNKSGRPIQVMRFDVDACFAHFQLALSLLLPDGTRPEPADCPIKAWPGVKGTLATGASEERHLDLAQLFPSVRWTAGRYGIDAAWHPDALAASFEGAYAWGSDGWSINDTHFTLAPVVGAGRVERGQELKLPDGARFAFTAHGHKRTMADGPPSPLIIHGTFAAPGKEKGEPIEVFLQTEEGRLFHLDGGYTFELVKHEYDGWMELRYFGKLGR